MVLVILLFFNWKFTKQAFFTKKYFFKKKIDFNTFQNCMQLGEHINIEMDQFSHKKKNLNVSKNLMM